MDNLGYAPMSGHAVIAAVTIALERQLLMPGGDGRTIVLDTPAGMVRARAHTGAEGRVDRVAFLGVPAFVLYPGLALKIGSRHCALTSPLAARSMRSPTAKAPASA